ncbi:hypothetical protein LCGC14_2892020 [marine sediment metagenome]|uniref:Uncharacterized protein n=1 Tax=marine sediment metagenome TaxID=412755 RepID=A0A0F8XXA1_9ZZZZ
MSRAIDEEDDMSGRGGCRPIGNAALMRRVKVIESLMPAKPNRLNGHGKPVGYNSAHLQHLDEVIGICRSIRSPSSNVADLHETISALRVELRHVRTLHGQLKLNNRKLRDKILVMNEETA